MLKSVCLAFVMITVAAVSLLAQGAGTVEAEAQSATAQQGPEAAHAAGSQTKFSGTLTGGVSLESGTTNLNGVQLDFEGSKPYSAKGQFEARFSYAYSTTKPADLPVRVTVEERFTGGFDLEHSPKPSVVVMARTEFMRNLPGSIEHRLDEMLGVGPVMRNDRVQVRVVPGVSLFTQNVRVPPIDGYHTFYGFYQDSQVSLNKLWTFKQVFILQRQAGNGGDYYYEGQASLTGAITRILGLQVRFEHTHENLLPPGVVRRYQKIMTGLQVKF